MILQGGGSREEALVQRLLKRAEIEGRSDDNEETIRNRMRVYRAQTEPLVAHFRAQRILIEVDEHHQRVKPQISRLVHQL